MSGIITGKIKYKGLDAAKLMSAFEETGAAVLADATIDAKRLLKTVVGTQYASLDELRMAGHPYAKASIQAATYKMSATTNNKPTPKAGAMPMPAGYVNKQGGGFYGSFVWEAPRKRGAHMIVEVQSDEPDLEQMLINGTPTMVSRPFKTLFMALMRDKVFSQMGNAFRKALRIRLVLAR